ncbi:MAG: alanine--tRNA ligase [Candidatus Omnitrophica bacterium]|nr:alanine--tRNA ligase [Candidatus Omnitrophota bacterium]
MKTDELRNKFLDFFASKGHKVVESDSLVPAKDPSVLFTSAGMNQFKEQFMGNITDFRRAASSQKCLRTADLINVGKSPSHHTFFEMLGNFSFGDYFKQDAISWAWEFVTEVLKLPEEKLWVSVHQEDQEAYKIWLEKIKIQEERIVKLGDKDNFWPANAPKDGPNGPCGPCSEIFYDWTGKCCEKADCNPSCNCGRFTEIWNLVFTQYDRQSDGSLLALPSKNIDTGMGLERIASVMQNVRENYQTDLFVPILNDLKEHLERSQITPEKTWFGSSAKTIADHIRAAVFSIADGVMPSNEARGYVIRKLIRRSIMNMKQAGVKEPFCYRLVYVIAKTMEKPYPYLLKRHETIAGIIKKEEEMFWSILKERSPLAEEKFTFYEKLPFASATFHGTALDTVPVFVRIAKEAFTLYDTYGVPLEISKEIINKLGIKIPVEDFEEEFEKEMEMQRNRSRNASQISSEIFSRSTAHLFKGLTTEFTGYDSLESDAKVMLIIEAKVPVDAAQSRQEVEIVLDKTPFYAESGGQVADTGKFFNSSGFEAQVTDVLKTDKVVIHKVKITNGRVQKGMQVNAKVCEEKRIATARNHTATHLLQYALRKVLGESVEQAGSYVSWEKLRFDFPHLSALKKETIENVEAIVNQCIMENMPVETMIMDIAQAKKTGALAFFGEKYESYVRVLAISDKSKELCAGTHVKQTGQIGLFKITAENSVAQGIRRIEAVTGAEAFSLFKDQEKLLNSLCTVLNAERERLIEAAQKSIDHSKNLEKELRKYKLGSLERQAGEIAAKAVRIEGINVIIEKFDDCDADSLRKISDCLRSKLDPVICVLMAQGNAKPIIIVSISKSLADKGFDAVKIIKELTALAGGGGGGKKELAQAGAKDIESLNILQKNSKDIIRKFITG